MKIPLQRAYYTGRETAVIREALQGPLGGGGRYLQKNTSWLEDRLAGSRVLMTTSATHALEMAALLLELQPGDEVIMPSFTFPSTANAVLLRGARPVFAEIGEETLNIDPGDIEKKITRSTRAIIPVHYGGVGCQMDIIMELAQSYGLYVIEDAAQAVNARYRGKPLGTWGHLGCYSFHGTKNYSCGEGGALLLNHGAAGLLAKSEIIWQKGTNRRAFLLGQTDRYTWMGVGSNYLPSELQMALLATQLEEIVTITNLRRQVFEYYTARLKTWVERGVIRTAGIPGDCESNYHLFYIRLRDERTRDTVMTKLRTQGIEAAFHFIPLHSSPMGKSLGYQPGDLPVTEEAARTLLRLPLYAGLTGDERDYVMDCLESILAELE